MADTAVAITAGSGTNIDTRTESTNGNHRQVICLGDQTTNASIAKVLAGSTAPAATDEALVVAISPNSVNANGSATSASSAPVVLPSDYGVPLESNKIFAGTTSLTPKFAAITASSSGNNTAVAAVTSKKIRVLSYDYVVNGAVNVKWRSATAGDVTGLAYFSAAGGGLARNFSPLGHFETTAGEALQINLSAAVAIGGSLVYVEV